MLLGKGVFYRTYSDFTLVYNTITHKYYKFTASVGEFLDYLKQGKSYSEIKNEIAKRFSLSDEYVDKTYDQFVELLKKENIIVENKNEATLEEHCVFESSLAVALYSVALELTYSCNEHCKHCYVCNTNRKELSLDDYKIILLQLKEMNVMNLVLTGGEVLCKKDFLEIYKYATEGLGFAVDIYSNGNLFDDTMILEVARSHPRSVHFSIYSLREEVHDAMTGIKGSLFKTLEVAQKFIDLGVAVNFKTLVMKNNYKEINLIIDYANRVGATLQIGTAFQLTHEGNDAPLEFMLNEEEIIDTFPRVFQQIGLKKDDRIAKRPGESALCSAGFSNIAINPYGDVFPCLCFPMKIGNVLEQDIKSLWNGSVLTEWRKKRFSMVEKCADCEISSICSFCPGLSLQYNGTPLKCYHNACVNTQAVLKYVKGGI